MDNFEYGGNDSKVWGTDDDGNEKPFDVDKGSRSQISIEHDHALNHKGYGFDADELTTLADTTPKYLHIRVGAKPIHLKQRDIVTSTDNILIRVYKNPTVALNANPTELVISNSNQESQNASLVKIYNNSSVTDNSLIEANRMMRDFLPGSAGVGQTRYGGNYQSSWEKVLAANTDYVMKIERTSGTGAATVFQRFKFYEK